MFISEEHVHLFGEHVQLGEHGVEYSVQHSTLWLLHAAADRLHARLSVEGAHVLYDHVDVRPSRDMGGRPPGRGSTMPSSRGNVDQFPRLKAEVTTAPVRFVTISGADDFSNLAPVSELVARKILADGGAARRQRTETSRRCEAMAAPTRIDQGEHFLTGPPDDARQRASEDDLDQRTVLDVA
jgi:hypothetical protein